ncbi:MAG: iron ABC transporter permease, partial [Planctomycetales bacterium]|nr:iron ABC transporter permease [Planctomycetales bacterium]
GRPGSSVSEPPEFGAGGSLTLDRQPPIGATRISGPIGTLGRFPLRLLANTCLLAVAAIAISLPVGVAIAVYIERTDLRFRRFIRGSMYALLFVPTFVHVAAWDAGFGLQGWFGYATGAAVLSGWRATIWLHALTAIPWVTMIATLGLRYSSASLEELALLENGARHAFKRITLRAAFPSIVGCAIWVFIVAANEITITDVYQVRTYAEEVYVGFALGDGVYEAQARVLPGSLLVTVLVIASVRIGKHFVSFHERTQQRTPRPFHISKFRRTFEVAILAFVVLIIAVPLYNLLYKVGIVVEQSGDERVRLWSVAKVFSVLIDSPFRYASELRGSFILGQIVSVTTVAFAFILAWFRKSKLATCIGWTVAIAGLAIPAPILALSIVRLFSQSQSPIVANLYDSIFVSCVVLTIRCFPFAYLLAIHSVNSVGRRVFEAAALDGLTSWQQLRIVGLRSLSPFFVATWVICFAWVIGELSATILTVPPGFNTISVTMFNLVHYGVEDRLAGLCIVVIGLSAMLAWTGINLIHVANDSPREISDSNV